MSKFSPSTARAVPGPAWARARRVAAAERFAASSLPSTDEEVWRYSRVNELDLDAYTPAMGDGGASVPDAVRHLVTGLGPVAASVIVADGSVVEVEGAGIETGEAVPEDAVGMVATEAVDVFSTLNDAFVLDPVVVRIPRGAVLDGPIVVVHWTGEDGLATFPRLVVVAGEGSSAQVVDVHLSPDGIAAFTAPVVELAIGGGAHLGYTNIQSLGLGTWQIAAQVSRVGADATFVSATAGFGGDYARQRTDCRLAGRGASGDLLAVYFGEAEQTLDFRTFQDHAAPDTTSNLLFKGAVGGSSRSVYTGMIRVRKDARGTNAFQTNRNIKLSEQAWAESVPNLEIENNDVKCSHASAVGPIDEDQRFYLESRGVPPEAAERLIVNGFFEEVIGRVPTPSAAPALRGAVVGKLARRDIG